MFKAKIITGNWEEGTLEVSGMPETFILSSREVVIMEKDEYEDLRIRGFPEVTK